MTFLYVLKGRFEDKLKAKTLDIYCGKSHIECYNFCQQFEDYFTITGTNGPNQILFAASFFAIKSTSTNNNISKSKKEKTRFQFLEPSSKHFL